ncbi:dynamin-like GTPase OPA1, mitochondrial isoform X2 [Watersipora subatra]|uniref:dynamin-like GTPase OPA1, mitochondrial isoform X2 n=1 Tax=Watersipora subatra TaxID=2589382 RepID=UPI00355B685A
MTLLFRARLRPTFSGVLPIRRYRILRRKIDGGLLSGHKSRVNPWDVSVRRNITGGILRTLPRFLKFRYLLLGGTVTGGVAAGKKYDKWKESLPDSSWLLDYFPKSDEMQKRFSGYWSEFKKSSLRMQQHLSLPDATWIPSKLAESWKTGKESINNIVDSLSDSTDSGSSDGDVNHSLSRNSSESGGSSAERAESKDIQEELMALQIQYQREIDRLEKDNRELRRQILLRRDSTSPADPKLKRSMRRSAIDMYSEVLDELSVYDTTYDTHDHLPRVVVVGDQSSGKTSVLEMIAQARIFPRGSGEMMTRSPVMVTLSEGPFHVAKFRDSPREFDLTKESELAALRREVEGRMRNSVGQGQTISSDVISMTVKGPGLQRMVLVDLPGVISTVTTGMATDTKRSIQALCRKYMENPNAIILCIQDGSIDAERSNVTDLVSSIDTEGKRTIFVLTKVDMAESSLRNPERIKKILDGRLFPMKALGYFAVVTGKGSQNDSIQSIKDYEEQFFKTSKVFRDSQLKPSQMSTRNMSMAVSGKFWKMVQDSVEQQADEFKATRYNLETEWKNTYPGQRELDRMELFEKAKGEILDQLITLSQISSKEWEDEFSQRLWDRTCTHVFESIYLPASSSASLGSFNTKIDIKLKQWSVKSLPQTAVEVGFNSLRNRYRSLVEEASKSKVKENKDSDLAVSEPFKMAVIDEVFRRHQWDDKAEGSLRVLQQSCLEDKSIKSKDQWEEAVMFMEKNLQEMLSHSEQKLRDMTGPGWAEQWTSWRSRTSEQTVTSAVSHELERLLGHENTRKAQLSPDELTTIKKNLQTQKVDVSDELIRETWHQVYRKEFLQQSLNTAKTCRKAFGFYQKGLTPEQCGLDCKDVLLFWRVQQMLQTTSNALRQQVTNHEARRLERLMKEVLDDYGEDKSKLEQLLSGRRVKLAEDLKRVRHIQDKLEEFIQCLNRDKS